MREKNKTEKGQNQRCIGFKIEHLDLSVKMFLRSAKNSVLFPTLLIRVHDYQDSCSCNETGTARLQRSPNDHSYFAYAYIISSTNEVMDEFQSTLLQIVLSVSTFLHITAVSPESKLLLMLFALNSRQMLYEYENYSDTYNHHSFKESRSLLRNHQISCS